MPRALLALLACNELRGLLVAKALLTPVLFALTHLLLTRLHHAHG